MKKISDSIGIHYFVCGFIFYDLCMPDSLVIMWIGQFLIGGFSVFFVITWLPEMIKDAVEGNPDKQLEVTDISSGVFNWMLGSGQMLGPIYGSFISNAFNFRLLADSVAWSLIWFSLAYFAVWNGYQALKNQSN